GLLSGRDSTTWETVFRGLKEGSARFQWNANGVFEVLPLDAEQGLAALPRIGIYAPWQGDMDEGWMRYAFDSAGLPFVRVRNEMLRSGALSSFLDVLVLPGTSSRALEQGRAEGSVPAQFTGGLVPEGSVAIEEFVRGGGKVIA